VVSAVSARGLFRATGNKSKPVVQMNLDGSYERVDHLEREGNDFYPTPPEPTRAFLSVEHGRLADFPLIWEPAAGDGAMALELMKDGHRVYSSDLIDRGFGAEIRSFYDYQIPPAKAIVTNPPFAECNGKGRWPLHALGIGVEYMALLLPFNWPGAYDRAGLWAKTPPARGYLLRWRIDFTGQGAPPMLNAWFVWDNQHEGETVLRMLDRSTPAQGALL